MYDCGHFSILLLHIRAHDASPLTFAAINLKCISEEHIFYCGDINLFKWVQDLENPKIKEVGFYLEGSKC